MKYNIESLRRYRNYATPEQVRDGRNWYKLALLEATNMALAYGVPVRTAAGVIAALSPRKTWAHNLRLAHELLGDGDPRTIGAHLHTAHLILAVSEDIVPPTEYLRGMKTRDFYLSIMGEQNNPVIDVWMMRALGVSSSKLTPKQYAELAEVVRLAAFDAAETPAEYQAIVWCAIRGKSF